MQRTHYQNTRESSTAVASSAISNSFGFSFGDLKMRSDLHLARKAWHMGMGLFILGVHRILDLGSVYSAALLFGFFMIFYVSERIRLKNEGVNKFILKIFGPLMRKHEAREMSGIPSYLGAATLVFLLFPEEVAVWSLLLLIFGDPLASLAGILWGDKSIRFKSGKSLIGTMAGVIVCGLVSYLFLTLEFSQGSSLVTGPYSLLLGVLAGAVFGGLSELIPIGVDDNFSIPVVSAVGIYSVLTFLI